MEGMLQAAKKEYMRCVRENNRSIQVQEQTTHESDGKVTLSVVYSKKVRRQEKKKHCSEMLREPQ